MTSTLLSTSRRASLQASELLEQLGYELDPTPVDLGAWKDAGFELPLADGDALTHLGRIDEVELLRLQARSADAARHVLEAYRAWNQILRPLVLVDLEEGVELWGWGENGRIGRLLVPHGDRPQETARRLDLIAARPGRDLGTRLETALSRESVSDRFFRRFSDAVRVISSELQRQNHDGSAARDWALLFLSRILFLFFIQEKEWLDGNRRYLLDAVERKKDLLDELFRPLFFECLNTRPSRRGTRARRLGRIPYLNGGLFRPSRFERDHPELEVSDDLLRSILHDVFARFPFTISEDDSSVVAIDPEMLGHVFESLMEEGERARTGSFYTPKFIVDRLVGRALREWMSEEPTEPCADASGDAARLERIRSITVLDPACGSGAFLLAAMKEIERVRRALGDDRPDRLLRQEIVERSLFGVDLKREAVALCELRLWLAIVAARPSGVEAISSIQPLPNLDRNILQGNALLDAVSTHRGTRMSIFREWRRAIRRRSDLSDAYRHATGARREALSRRLRESDLTLGSVLIERAIEMERDDLAQVESQKELFDRGYERRITSEIRMRIEDLERDLSRLKRGELNLFSYDLHFSQAMDRGGFDLVVGNPPWVRGSRVPTEMRETLRSRYRWLRPVRGEMSGFPQFELSILFLESATRVARDNGIVSMLVPGKISSAFYAERCRRELTENHRLIAIDDWTRERDLFDADTFPVGLTFASNGGAVREVEILRDGESWSSRPENLTIHDGAGPWLLLPDAIAQHLRRLWRRHRTLAEVLGREPVMGVKTGDNALFFLEENGLDRRGLLTPDGVRIPWKALTRCVRGRDVRRWRSSDSTWMLWPDETTRNGWKREYAATKKIDERSLKLSYVRPEHLGWKVVWKDVAMTIEAVVVPDSVEIHGRRVPLVPNQTLYCLDSASVDETYLVAAILNSSLVSSLARIIADPAKDRHYRFFGRTIAGLPWPEVKPDDDEGRALVRLARAAHAGTDVQEEIDRRVAAIYGVESDVVDALERWL